MIIAQKQKGAEQAMQEIIFCIILYFQNTATIKATTMPSASAKPRLKTTAPSSSNPPAPTSTGSIQQASSSVANTLIQQADCVPSTDQDYSSLVKVIGNDRLQQLGFALSNLIDPRRAFVHIRLAGTNFRNKSVTCPGTDVKDGLPIQPQFRQSNWVFSLGLNYMMGGFEIPAILALPTMLETPPQTTSPTFTINDLMNRLPPQEDPFPRFDPNDPKSKENAAIKTFLSTAPYKEIHDSLQNDNNFKTEITEKNVHQRKGFYEDNPHQRLVALTLYNVVDLLQRRQREKNCDGLSAETLHEWELRTSIDQGDTHNVALIANFTQTNDGKINITSCILDPITQYYQNTYRKNQGPDYRTTIPLILKHALAWHGITVAQHVHKVVYLGNQFGGYCTSHAQRLAEKAEIKTNQDQQVTLVVPQEGMMHDGAYNSNYEFNTSVVCEEIAWSVQRLSDVCAKLNNPNNTVHQFVYRTLLENNSKDQNLAFSKLKTLLNTLDQIQWNMRTDQQRVLSKNLIYVNYEALSDNPPVQAGSRQLEEYKKHQGVLIKKVQENHSTWPLPEWMQIKLTKLNSQDWSRLAPEFLEILVQQYDQETPAPTSQEQVQNPHAMNLTEENNPPTNTCCCVIS